MPRKYTNPARRTGRSGEPDLADALANVSPAVRRAFQLAHAQLASRGIPHVLIGGIAVGAYGHHYATKAVDFLVGDEIVDPSASRLVMIFAPGVPVQVGDVGIDYLDPDVAKKENPQMVSRLARLVDQARKDPDKVVIAPLDLLIYLKLLANRPKDRTALLGLLSVGAVDLDLVRETLTKYAPDKLPRFERLVQQAERL